MTTWLVTGANRGLGLAIAQAALDAGHTVAVGARRPDSVPRAVADHPRVHVVPLDVTDRTGIDDAVAQVQRELGGIDVLVNNAGHGFDGAIEEIALDEARALFDVNVWGLLSTTQAVLPGMRAAGRGTVVNIGSLAGFVGRPGVGLYNASKFAVEALSEAMRGELAPFGIGAMVVEPGTFRTDFLDKSSMHAAATTLDAYADNPARGHTEFVAANNHRQLGDPAKAAALIVEVVDAGDVPAHLPVGADSLQVLADAVATLTADADRWRERSAATRADDDV